MTSDGGAARELVLAAHDVYLTETRGGNALVVRAEVTALDELVTRLVQAGVAVRELAPVVSPLEAAFLALTGQPDGDR